MAKTIIAPSILSADFLKLGEELERIEKAGADWVHFDVMDGHFVPNISFGIPVLKSIAHGHNLINDVHIMISDPKFYAPKFIAAGADYLTFHFEACKDVRECLEVIDLIHALGAKAGISFKPRTDVKKIVPLLRFLDLVLVMSVEPGFGGQQFMKDSVSKIVFLKDYKNNNPDAHYLIEVDGGINETTGQICRIAGADVLVAGSYIFGQEDYEFRISELKK
ncbi:MAG: ribulose-phosphate 3-epimerase [Bacilli bacterium]|jgi:ribulose-phosphate 3-epimerase|nr:ribulose-phosphate 3-epimerase [Bacilli bacterium]